MLELEYKSKIIKKLLVIKEICSWLQTFRPSNPGGTLERHSGQRTLNVDELKVADCTEID